MGGHAQSRGGYHYDKVKKYGNELFLLTRVHRGFAGERGTVFSGIGNLTHIKKKQDEPLETWWFTPNNDDCVQ